jgi:hypothetical protein
MYEKINIINRFQVDVSVGALGMDKRLAISLSFRPTNSTSIPWSLQGPC